MDRSPIDIITILVIILGSLSLHEYAHAKVADSAGDPTPGFFGRVTLNPLAHLDPMGTLLIVLSAMSGYGFGWGKPVPMDPRKMKNPRWDHFWAVFAGPLTNLMLAIIFAVLFKMMVLMPPAMVPSVLQNAAIWGIIINITLFTFNLVPVGPLDGMWIAGTFMPEKQRYHWTKFNLTYGIYLFLALVLFRPGGMSIIGYIVQPIREIILTLLLR